MVTQEPLPFFFVKLLRWRQRITLPKARRLLSLHFSLELNLLHDSEQCNCCQQLSPGGCDTKNHAVVVGILVILACKALFEKLREPKVCDEEMTEICSSLLLHLCELDEWHSNDSVTQVQALSSIGQTLLENVVGGVEGVVRNERNV